MRPRAGLRTLAESLVFAAALVMVFFILRVVGVIETESGNARAIDGDSLRIGGRDIRLHGIDAPELRQPCSGRDGREWACGQEARAALASLVRNRETACRPVDTDRYGRMVAECAAGGVPLGAEMVRQGLAVAYLRHSRRHAALEAEARRKKLGIWRGSFTPPEDWRAAHRLVRGDVVD